MRRKTRQVRSQQSLDAQILEAAILGLTKQKDGIEENIRTVRRMLRENGHTVSENASYGPELVADTPPQQRRQRRMSAAARAAISAATKKRWRAFRKAKEAASAVA